MLAARLLAALALAAPACTAYELSMEDVEQFKEEVKEIPVPVPRAYDYLFVIDDSGSMGEEQAALIASFPAMIDVLEQIEGGLPNVHLAVVSTDMGAGGHHVAGCGAGHDGAFQVAPRIPGCAPPDGAYLRNVKRADGTRETNYEGTLAEALACIAQLGTTGCGFEQPLAAMRRALERAQTPGDPNHGFLRPEANLVVVFITDEDDCSVVDPALFAPAEAYPAVRLQHLLAQFPDRDAFTTICSTDLADGVAVFSELLPVSIGNPCITGALRDVDPETPELDAECVVADVRDPHTDQEDETILPPCDADEDLDPTNLPSSTNLPCWHLARDPMNCSQYPTQLALVVERGGTPVRTGTYVRARCRTE